MNPRIWALIKEYYESLGQEFTPSATLIRGEEQIPVSDISDYAREIFEAQQEDVLPLSDMTPAEEVVWAGQERRRQIKDSIREEMMFLQDEENQRKKKRKRIKGDARTRLGLGAPSAYAKGGTGRFLFRGR
jgi:hypothetical protein